MYIVGHLCFYCFQQSVNTCIDKITIHPFFEWNDWNAWYIETSMLLDFCSNQWFSLQFVYSWILIRDRDEMVVYNSCCWRFSLRSGCIFVAILEIIILILMNVKEWSDVEVTIMILINFIGAILLIYGTITEKTIYLWLWLTTNVIVVSFLGFFAVMCVLGLQYSQDDASRYYFLVYWASIFATLAAVKIGFASIVYSYTCKLREQPGKENYQPVWVNVKFEDASLRFYVYINANAPNVVIFCILRFILFLFEMTNKIIVIKSMDFLFILFPIELKHSAIFLPFMYLSLGLLSIQCWTQRFNC